MIRISLGGVGSGKTASEVRDMFLDATGKTTYTNIAVKGKHKNIKRLTPDLIIKKEIAKQIKRKDGSLQNIYDYKINIDYWKELKEPVNIVIDEFHNIANARASMSKKNRVFNTWLTMIRRVLGSSDALGGNLILISQLSNQVDLIARALCHQVRYHVCHYEKSCRRCNYRWHENSEMPESIVQCPRCKTYNLDKFNHKIEIWHFSKMEKFMQWKDFGMKTFYRHYIVWDIEEYFPRYDTLQWDNLFEEY